MKTYTRKISHIEAKNIVAVIDSASKLADCDIGANQLVVAAGFTKKIASEFKKEIEDLAARAEAEKSKGNETVDFVDADKNKKDIELKHVEISMIANVCIELLRSKECTLMDAELIRDLCSGECLMLERHINKNVNMEKIELIEDLPENDDLIPEEIEK